MQDEEDTNTYAVVVNDEEQYSIWLDDQPLPDGWRREGVVGGKAECLAHIEQVWTDLRPLSLRRWMDEQQSTAERGDQVVRG
ncbi:MbtH family NRPS accessory protein [Natronosporangium hydrolyticum]|uniref:MbtH family NRPS accessory protein n=1 Tax=Natronosporangium hydrolyticum TaxID=2811111 RepID=A0A895YQD0_9ACTN|nr:MbtH family NRPS accessory protein [Natronosporangium hydrolyticum]QSB16330.1 MbtH family NRPS accessory protein [Natronosporangium hydrolyticum]